MLLKSEPKFNRNQLNELIKLISSPTPKEDLTGRTISLHEFARKYCYPHGIDWVKREILYRYKPLWCPNRHPGKGRAFTIFEKPAARWMEQYRDQLPW